ncbi:hypothetical protein JJB09_01635 [Rhizobium sp. KVB221]|uniref:Uncharacterized protein n=1 Tax=Rhizobium setariae TaxID=2801340 RepID=A0A937CMA8_9HYPH|nr:hypothetical protein [Rhizobium setariae]MBL0370719.1 hypothetical protein [Rhizobium setariae]
MGDGLGGVAVVALTVLECAFLAAMMHRFAVDLVVDHTELRINGEGGDDENRNAQLALSFVKELRGWFYYRNLREPSDAFSTCPQANRSCHCDYPR